MAIVCPSCGAENRDKARFCRGCARPLDRLGGEPVPGGSDDPARARRRARRRRAAAVAARNARPAWSRRMGVIVATVIALGAGWWLGIRQTSPSPVQAAPLPVAAAPATPPAAPPVAEATPSTPTTSAVTAAAAPPADAAGAALAVDRLRHSVELLEQQDRVRAAALEQQRTKLIQDRQRADDARRKTDALAAAAAGVTAHAAPAPAPAPAPVAQAPAPAAVTAAAAPSVDQLCAGSSNVFSRDFCRMRECGKASFANDPVCVRFRQMEESRRQEAEHR